MKIIYYSYEFSLLSTRKNINKEINGIKNFLLLKYIEKIKKKILIM